MSFILDALEKADKKRKTGEVPDLQTMHGLARPGSGRRKWWPYLVVALLVVQTVSITAWLLMKPDPEGVEEQSPPVATTPPPESAPARQAKIEPQQPVVIVLKENIPPRPVQAQQPVQAQMESPQPAPPIAPIAPVIPSSAENKTVFAPETSPPLQLEEQKSAAAPVPSLPATSIALEKPAIAEQPAVPVSEEKIVPVQHKSPLLIDDSHERDELPDFSELPASVQRELSDISISYHAYANNPASRLVSINGRILRQGQEVATGLLLEEITSAGVVLKFRNHRFRMKVF